MQLRVAVLSRQPHTPSTAPAPNLVGSDTASADACARQDYHKEVRTALDVGNGKDHDPQSDRIAIQVPAKHIRHLKAGSHQAA